MKGKSEVILDFVVKIQEMKHITRSIINHGLWARALEPLIVIVLKLTFLNINKK